MSEHLSGRMRDGKTARWRQDGLKGCTGDMEIMMVRRRKVERRKTGQPEVTVF